MTDKKTETSKDDSTRSQSSVLTTPASKRAPSPEPPKPADKASKQGSRSVLAPAALVVALLAVGLAGVAWQKQGQIQESQAQLASQLAGSVSAAERSAGQTQELSERIRQQETRIESLQGQLGEAATVIQNLDEALRSMTDRGSELVLLNDVDHLVTIAQQQLQLGGNVRNAIVALESAQAQLSRANRPALASLLQTLNGDIDRLRAASTIDIAAFSAQLEELAVLLTEAPLITPDGKSASKQSNEQDIVREQPAPTVVPAPEADPAASWWEQAWDTTRNWSSDALGSLREDLGQFIEVRRVDDAHALLMSPDQATRFRDNLRTRVMTAQLALMMRQSEVWKTETEAVVKAIESRYDESSPLTRKALRLARGMADARIDARLPTVDNTLHVLAGLREEQSRSFGGAEPANGPGNTPVETPEDATDAMPDTGTDHDSTPAPEAGDSPADPQATPEESDSMPQGGEALPGQDQPESEPDGAVPAVSEQMES